MLLANKHCTYERCTSRSSPGALIPRRFTSASSHLITPDHNDRRTMRHRNTRLAEAASDSGSTTKDHDGSQDVNATPIERRHLLALGAFALMYQTVQNDALAMQGDSGTMLRGEALDAVRQAVAASVPRTKGPAVLRVLFHDAGTYSKDSNNGGANASIRFESKRPENKGIKRGLNCVSAAMTRIQGTPAETLVSYADMICICAAYAVEATGGPKIDITVGRQDTEIEDPTGRLPAETLSIEELKSNFRSKGFDCQEFVALCGSHTIGGKGFGESLTFDNAYYKALLTKPWDDPTIEMREMIGLPSDRVLADDKECLPYIQLYATDQGAFFRDFSKATIKLANCGATWTMPA